MLKLKKILSILARVFVSCLLLVFLFRQVDEKSLLSVIKQADKNLVLLAFGLFILSYLLCLFRWEMLLKAVKIKLPLRRIIISYSGGIFFNLFLPSTIGGDLMRSIDMAAHTKRTEEVIATVFLDRLSGYIGLVILAGSALIVGWDMLGDKSVLLTMIVITAILVAILVVLFNRWVFARITKFLHAPNAGKIRELVKNLHREIHIFRQHKSVIVKNLALSVLIQAIPPLVFYVLALSLGIKIKLLYCLIFLPIIGAITLLPISIGGLGLRDATTIYFFSKIGVEKDISFAMSLLSFSFVALCGVAGGLVYVLTVRHRRLQYNKPSHI